MTKAETNLTPDMNKMGQDAKRAFAKLRGAGPETRTKALKEIARAIEAARADILKANEEDVAAARGAGLSKAKVDRLILNDERIDGLVSSVKAIAGQDDPAGEELARWQRPNGLDIARVRGPIGVIGMIYESRPNVTADAASLCVRSGNAVMLRGGRDAQHSSAAIHGAVQKGLEAAGLPKEVVQLVPPQDRALVGEMLGGLNGAIDLIIPRGGASLVERVQNEARVPVLGHLEGLCHMYLHPSADPQKATEIVVNSKLRRTGVCGALETLLVDRKVAEDLLPKVAAALEEKGCELRGDAEARKIVPSMKEASEEDWRTEYLDAILAVKIVDDLDSAVEHIAEYGSQHTEAIIAEDEDAAEDFMAQIDSAIVFWNAATQFADGGEFGMGAEIGIATGRLHARGPVGAEQLTTFRYVVRGNGQTRP